MFDKYDDLLNVEDLCEILMIGKNAAYTLLASGEQKAYRAGTRRKIPRESVTWYVRNKASYKRRSCTKRCSFCFYQKVKNSC